MITPSQYGASSQYFTGSYPIAGASMPPARFLSGLATGAAYNVSNLGIRQVAAYSGFNQPFNGRLTVAGVMFFGIRGPGRAVFPVNSDWSLNKSGT